MLPTTCNDEGDDDSDDDDRFDDKTTAVTDDDYDDSDASFVCVSVCVPDLFSSSSDWIPEQKGVLLIFARMSGVCVFDRESVDYTLLSNTESRHFSSVCNYSEHTAS